LETVAISEIDVDMILSISKAYYIESMMHGRKHGIEECKSDELK
jgi:hypothetical protein